MSAAHSHSVHGKAWSTLHRPLDPLTQDACAFYGDHVVFDDYTGAVLDPRRASASPTPSATQGGHPARTTACSPSGTRSTRRRGGSSRMERTCQAQLLAEAAGTPVLIDPDVAETTAGQTGGHRAGWRQFQPLYDWIVAEQPDLLDE